MKTFISSISISFITFFCIAQTPAERAVITSNYDLNYLQDLSVILKKDSDKRKQEAFDKAAIYNWPTVINHPDGSTSNLMYVNDNNDPVYYTTYDINSINNTRTNFLHPGGDLGLSLDGSNMQIGVWDSNSVLITHNEFNGRVTIGDTQQTLSSHATFVTGIIIAEGFNSQAKGMAPKAEALTHSYQGDYQEVVDFAAEGGLISNHSYGYNYEETNPWIAGTYDYNSRTWDMIMYNVPYYLKIDAVGNYGSGTEYSSAMEIGYDKLVGKCSKNGIVVAIADNISIGNDGELISADVHPDSSQGPTDDLRIKPEVCADGTNVYSCTAASNSSYFTSSVGSSHSSPNVAGTLLILQQHSNNINNKYMLAATLKGLALHTADDMLTPGPDAISGWGLMNAKKAAQTLSNNNLSSIIDERKLYDPLDNGALYTIDVASDGVNPLEVSISWTDKPGIEQSGSTIDINNPTPRLINDLQLRVKQDNSLFSPYLLQSASVTTTGINNVDPFEKVEINNAEGIYTIEVYNDSSLEDLEQDYSLIITGITICTAANANIFILNPVVTNTTEIEIASNDIKTSNTIETNATANYIAGNSITLEENFHSENNSEFYARINKCTNVSGAIGQQRPVSNNDSSSSDETIEESISNNILLYPNPATHKFTIDAGSQTIKTVTIRTLENKYILSQKVNGNRCYLDVSNISAGMYIVTIENNKGDVFYKKLIIE